jgi:hypothetical protein
MTDTPLQATIARDLGAKLYRETDTLTRRHLALAETERQRVTIARLGATASLSWLASCLSGHRAVLAIGEHDDQVGLWFTIAACAAARELTQHPDPIEAALHDVAALMMCGRLERVPAFVDTMAARAQRVG